MDVGEGLGNGNAEPVAVARMIGFAEVQIIYKLYIIKTYINM